MQLMIIDYPIITVIWHFKKTYIIW